MEQVVNDRDGVCKILACMWPGCGHANNRANRWDAMSNRLLRWDGQQQRWQMTGVEGVEGQRKERDHPEIYPSTVTDMKHRNMKLLPGHVACMWPTQNTRARMFEMENVRQVVGMGWGGMSDHVACM
jgi:hypothetical protein